MDGGRWWAGWVGGGGWGLAPASEAGRFDILGVGGVLDVGRVQGGRLGEWVLEFRWALAGSLSVCVVLGVGVGGRWELVLQAHRGACFGNQSVSFQALDVGLTHALFVHFP